MWCGIKEMERFQLICKERNKGMDSREEKRAEEDGGGQKRKASREGQRRVGLKKDVL